MPTITGRTTSKRSPFEEMQRLPVPTSDAEKREVSRIRRAFEQPSTALSRANLSGVEYHILDTTADAYRL